MDIYKLISLLICIFCLSTPVQAIQISSLAEIANEQGEAVFTVKNTELDRVFLNVVMYKLSVKNGKIEKTEYTRENLQQWKINVYPARTIIEPGFEKDFRVTLVAQPNQQRKEDELYQLAFIPTPYFKDGDDHANQAVQMAVGFASLFIVPGQDIQPKIKADYDGKSVQLINIGPNAARAEIDFCIDRMSSTNRRDCRRNLYILSGRELTIPKPDSVPSDSHRAKVEVKSLRGSHSQILHLEAKPT